MVFLRRRKGTTLIELMVVVAIIGIMTAVVFVSLSRSRTHNEVAQAMRAFASDVREAQNAALTGRKFPNHADRDFCYYWAVAAPNLEPTGMAELPTYTKYRLNYSVKKMGYTGECPTDSASISGDLDHIVYATKDLLNGVEFKKFTNGDVNIDDRMRFWFKPPHGTVYFDSKGDLNDFVLLQTVKKVILTKGTVEGYVCVYPSGRVEETFETTCP